MNQSNNGASMDAIIAKEKLSKQIFKKGIMIALFSGMSYGLYSAILTFAMTKGVWADWYGANTAGLSAFTITYMIGLLGGAVNDTCSSIWAMIFAIRKGKFGDFIRSINTAPGRMMILAALIGGPIAAMAYVISLQMAGSIAIPISALCPAISAILAKIFFKQELNKRMILGICICVFASFLIGSTSITGDAPEGMVIGIIIALIAAIGWGFEGCVAGYGTSMIDAEIGITIRQTVSGFTSLLVMLPIFGMIAGNIKLSVDLAVQAFSSGSSMIWFVISGFFAYISFMTWYRGNSMCGAALGMACNGTYSFWGPFFCWIVLGVINGIEGWSLQPVEWIGAMLMMFGILIVVMNPLDLFRKKEVK